MLWFWKILIFREKGGSESDGTRHERVSEVLIMFHVLTWLLMMCHPFVIINSAKHLLSVHFSVEILVLYFNKAFIIEHFKLNF